jgi:DNA-3-methyladenine glycosylase
MSNTLKPLGRKFFARDTLKVAKELLGKSIVRKINNMQICAKIVETEAYIGDHDPASHSYGRITERNKVMYGPAGYSYVYIIYGNYYCFNAVTGKEGEGNAVLIRAGEITEGEDLALDYRKLSSGKHKIANGPAKLCIALQIDKRFYGHDLTKKSNLFIAEGEMVEDDNIITSERIGLSKGIEFPYRFFIKGSPFVTKHKYNNIISKSNNRIRK